MKYSKSFINNLEIKSLIQLDKIIQKKKSNNNNMNVITNKHRRIYSNYNNKSNELKLELNPYLLTKNTVDVERLSK